MRTENPEQVEYWNNPGATRWVREQARLDRVLAPLQAAALSRAAPAAGERVVDIGCGCGDSTLQLADAVGPSGAVLGVDLSGPMLARAAERTGERENVSWQQADAAVHPFAGDADLVFSRFGVMFFGDPVAAFTNLRRALKPSGRTCFVCWRGREDNPWQRIPLGVAARFLELPPPPPPEAPGPLSLARPERVREVLDAAGYRDVALEAVDVQLVLSTTGVDEAVDFGLNASPVARVLGGVDAATLAGIRDGLREELARHLEGDTVKLDAGAWVVTAA